MAFLNGVMRFRTGLALSVAGLAGAVLGIYWDPINGRELASGSIGIMQALVTAGGAALCVLGAGLSASAGVLISLRAATVRQAAQTLSIGTMLLIFVPVYGIRALPAGIRAAGAAWLTRLDTRAALLLVLLLLAALDGALLAAARLRFQRAKLAVDA